MTTRSLYIVVLLGAAMLLAFVRVSGRLTSQSTPAVPAATDGAFRDGMYQAQLDVHQKRHAHITSGRWSTAQDRASFVAGYQQAYEGNINASRNETAAVDTAQLSGYTEGMADGVRDRKSAQRFQPAKNARIGQAALIYGAATDAYRQGYTNGYQQGYYSQEGSAAEMIGQASHQF